MSADESDSDPVRFWSHLIAGLQAVHPRAGAASLEALRAGPSSVASLVLPLLVDELGDARPSVLVVDDWHLVRSTACEESMRILLEGGPPAVQVVLSSRSDPNLPVGRWRAHGELSEVRAIDLQLSHAEAAAFLREANVDLGPKDIDRLTERTEGWAAGLSLASMLLQQEEDPHAFVLDFAGDSRHLLEYISDDVLPSVGEEMRAFMLRSSVLDELSGPACDAVLERRGSGGLLAEIERANLFLIPVDRHGERYRFHRLFTDVLRRELARTTPEVVAQLHARASAWFEAQGDGESAVRHAIAGRDLARASDLVTFHQRSLMNEGRLTTLARWLEELSWPEATAEPQLALVRASLAAQTAQHADQIERWLAVAAAGSRPGPLANGIASVESCIAILRSLYLTQGVTPAVAAAKRAVELEPPGSGWRRQALIGLGQALYLQGNADEARVPLAAAHRLPYAQDHAPAAAAVLAYLALAGSTSATSPGRGGTPASLSSSSRHTGSPSRTSQRTRTLPLQGSALPMPICTARPSASSSPCGSALHHGRATGTLTRSCGSHPRATSSATSMPRGRRSGPRGRTWRSSPTRGCWGCSPSRSPPSSRSRGGTKGSTVSR
jgi:LuxR family maltose regulon positive regulatory protein